VKGAFGSEMTGVATAFLLVTVVAIYESVMAQSSWKTADWQVSYS